MRKHSIFQKLLIGLFSMGIILYTLFPFYWAIVTSIKTGSQLYSYELLPKNPTYQNYISIFVEQPFAKNILNSVLVATTTVLLSLLLALLASYSLARKQFRGRKSILLAFLLLGIFPQIAILSGLFELIRALGIYNRWWALTLSYLLFTLPFTTWTLTAFMHDIPLGIEEAAMMDGASPLRILFQIFFPIMGPSVVTTGLLAFVAAWNEFLFALTFTLSEESRTVPVAIALMSGSSQYELPWGNIMAASVLVTVPLLLLVLFFQKRLISGLTAGAVKG